MELSAKILSEITVFNKYAKYLVTHKRRETWEELISRNKKMHSKKFPNLKLEIEEAYSYVYDKKVLPSMRSLQFAGKSIELNPSRIYNCSYCPVDDPKAFSESMFLLLGGTGVGYSVQQHHVDKLPPIYKPQKTRRFLIGDSIEGWADSIKMLFKAYMFGKSLPLFDFSDIRAKGARLITAGGKAPGPEPLKECLFQIQKVLDRKENGSRLSPIECHDIMCYIADAVLSGGIRRAAMISFFDFDNEEMISCKSGQWWELEPQRGRANNSAVILQNRIREKEFFSFLEKIKYSKSGEPGIFFTNDKDILSNPCLPSDTFVTLDTGLELIENLINRKFNVLVSGEAHSVTKKGFWNSGTKETIILKLKSGRKLELTANHKVDTINGWIPAEELKVGNLIIISNQQNFTPNVNSESNDFYKGYLLGSFIGDGNVDSESAVLRFWGMDADFYRKSVYEMMEKLGWISHGHVFESRSKANDKKIFCKALYIMADELECIKEEKSLSKKACTGSWSYLAGLVRGYFDADGCVQGDQSKGGISARLASINLENLENVQNILISFGINSKIYNSRHPQRERFLIDNKGGFKKYNCSC